MSRELTKEAAEMLLKGATLLGEPCPYCSGVRVMKDGFALCISCGSKPESRKVPGAGTHEESGASLKDVLEKKIEALSKELEDEADHERQQEILKSINSALEALGKIGGKQ